MDGRIERCQDRYYAVIALRPLILRAARQLTLRQSLSYKGHEIRFFLRRENRRVTGPPALSQLMSSVMI